MFEPDELVLMHTLKFPAGDDTPGINFDPSANCFKISGRSYPEDAAAVYEPVLDWLQEYVKSPNLQTNLSVTLDYFNSATSKQLYKIFSLLEEINTPFKAWVTWCYHSNDRAMQESGTMFSSLVDLDFQLTEINES